MKKTGLLFILVSLFISGCATAPHQPQVMGPAGIYHIVGSGQNLYRISQAYSVDMKEIMRVNNILDANQIGVGERLFIPGAGAKVPMQVCVVPQRASIIEPVERIVGRNNHRVKWRCITLHHSGTLEGNAESFDRNHRRRGMGGLFYHFIVDNGTSGCYDGEIEVGWRWRKQKEVNRKREIEICLVGNYNKQEVSAAQLDSLIKLLKVLTKEYSIPLCNIRRHKDIKGKITECPGSNFPLHRVLAELKKS